MNETQLREQFKRWANSPHAAMPKSPEPGTVEEAVQAGLWAAYRAGYAQALADTDGARRLVGFLKSQGGGAS